MNAMRRLGRVSLAAACAAVWAGVALAGKPGGGSDTKDSLPPVTPAYNFGVFQSRPDLGGVLDTSTNVVWGYSVTGVANYSVSYSYAMSANNWYAQTFFDTAQSDSDRAAYCRQQADAYSATDPAKSAQYQALADQYAAAAQKLTDAGNVAVQHSGWRPATLAEARDAVAKGLFTYGQGGLNLWTGSPADTTPGLPYGGRTTWSSDADGKKAGGFDAAWAYNPNDGSAARITQGSSADCFIVRTHTP